MRLTVQASIALAMISAAPTPPAVAQAGQWQVEVAPAQCRLNRSIAGAQPSAISIQTVPGSDANQLTLAGPALRGIVGAQLEPARLVFADSTTIDVRARAVRIDGELAAAVRINGIGPVLLDGLAAGDAFVLKGHNREQVTTIGDSAKAIAALRRCNADQLVEWGAEPSQFQPGGEIPAALKSRDEWIPNDQLIRISTDRSEFQAVLKVGISPDGTIDACDAIDDGGSSNVAKIACGPVLGRKLFTPARAPDGHAVRGAATFPIQMIRRPGR
jgi:hypothetical protein